GLDPGVVRRIFMEKSPEGIMALVWKSSMPAKMGAQIQQRMGRIAPSDVVMPTDDGKYPVADEELAWQIEFFTDLSLKGSS
ncbi:MAG: hypothetical protein ACE5GT_14795, partial [Rhodospirillales bacterium]